MADLAATVGVRPDTIRYYERSGLLPPPGRTATGYREYEVAAVDRTALAEVPAEAPAILAVDAAIVFAPGARFVVASMNEGSPQTHFRVDHEGNILNGRTAKAVFDAWVPEGAVPEGW